MAAIQAAPAFLDRAETLARLDTLARKAAAEGARIIVFPETWVPGYPAWVDASPSVALWDHPGAKQVHARLLDQSVTVPGPATESMAAVAAELEVTLVVGVNERAGRSLYNALLTFGPDGRLLNHHRKLVPTHGERLVWGQGDGAGLRVVTASGARVGGLICWEHWMPLARQALHDQDEQIHIAAWPEAKDMYQVASRHYAFEGRCFVVVAASILNLWDLPPELPVLPELNQAVGNRPLIRGGSAVIAPDGSYLAQPVFDREAIVLAKCDLGMIDEESYALDVSGHYSRRDVFELSVEPGRRNPEPAGKTSATRSPTRRRSVTKR